MRESNLTTTKQIHESISHAYIGCARPTLVMFSRSPHKDRPDDDHLPSASVCTQCKGINIDNLCHGQEYHHSSAEDISTSAKACGLCELIFMRRRMAWCTQHLSRYHFHVGLQGTTHEKQRSVHHNHTKRGLYIRVVDTTPWLGDPRYEGGGKYGKIEYEVDEKGHATTYYRPLGCFTTENDLAADTGVPHVRLLSATTSSNESYAIARAWLAQCLATEIRVNPVITNSDASGYIPDVCDDHAWGEADIQLDVDGDTQAPEIPRRLVDLQPDGLSSCQKRVVAIDDLAITYATLSYCWGDIYDRAWLTNRENLAQ